MTKLIITGAAGRMGRTLISLLAREPELTLIGAVEAAGSAALGLDAGTLAGVEPMGVPIGADYATLAAPDTVTLDFTNASAALSHLEIAAARGAAIAIGSTGFAPDMMARARTLASRTRTLIAPNMSLGVNVLSRLVSEVAAMLPEFDAEVLELHHRTKLDAPSGTALALGRAIAAARGQDFEANKLHGRQGIIGPRPEGQIGVMALRGGDAVGDHTVLFCGGGERLELIHRTQSREALARGALRAARWLAAQPNGLYSMADVLGL
ncbi:MAG TPA: 4-hydroxy-tetrahydrodipicolinate reductase [Candidatus Binataceae bacterium]|nr:4-hydroxy-tetrahydrodipicolinate reductase [Candidatus Binataceae bacterium]